MLSASHSVVLTVLLLLAVVGLDQVHGWGNRPQINNRLQRRQWPSSRYDIWQDDDDNDSNDDDDDDNYGGSWKNRGSSIRKMIQERRRQMKKYDNDDDDDDDDDYPLARGRQRISPTISRFHRLRDRYYRNRNQAARRYKVPDDDYWEDRAPRQGAVWGRQPPQQQGQQQAQQKGQMTQYSDTQILSLYGRMKQYLSSRGLAS